MWFQENYRLYPWVLTWFQENYRLYPWSSHVISGELQIITVGFSCDFRWITDISMRF
jgi:hypothetical protein